MPLPNHDEIEPLLPWYANGTLDETEMDAANQHLARCPACRRSLEAEVTFARALRAEPAEQHRLPSADEAWPHLARRLPAAAPRWPNRSAALLAVLTLAVAGGLFLVGTEPEPAFRTLTTDLPHDGPVIQIMFEPSTPEGRIRRLLRQAGGTVIAGPTATGIYRVGLPPGSDGPRREAELRDSPAVQWVTLEAP